MPTIRLCPLFFDPKSPHTKKDLGSKEFKKNPGRRGNSWCQPGSKFADIETAGNALLHEMTHLDEVGSKRSIPSLPPACSPSLTFKLTSPRSSPIELVQLSERPLDRDLPQDGSSHGTEDVYEITDPNYRKYDTTSPARAARELYENWAKAEKDDKKPKPILARVENAESYAASATEFLFMQQCGADTIDALNAEGMW